MGVNQLPQMMRVAQGMLTVVAVVALPMTRLIKQYRDNGQLVHRQRTVNGFARRFTDGDIQLLAQMDERHNTPNGLTMKKLCEQAYELFDDAEYQRLASISVAHLYNLRLLGLAPYGATGS